MTTRRKFLSTAAAITTGALIPGTITGAPAILRKLSSSSPLEEVNLGVITYSFRSMPSSAEQLLEYISQLGLRSVELMGEPAEEFLGAPPKPSGGGEDQKKWAEEMTKWRMGTSPGQYKKLKKMYKKEGVKIDVVKFRMDRMNDSEIDYCFEAAKALGAKGITLERSDQAAERLGPFASKHKKMVGYHNHAKVNFNSWDPNLIHSPYNALNLDVGHYMAGTNETPIPLIRKYHNRILNLHLKDRKKDEGPNMPWGQGDTPLKEVLQLLRDESYPFLAAIELEYPIPEGSDAVKEVKKCIEFCEEALS